MAPTPFYVAGRPESSDDLLAVTHPADGRAVGETSLATPEQVERAVAGAAAVADEAAALPAHVRAAALDAVSRGLADNADAVARTITGENGKPLKWARAEVSRATRPVKELKGFRRITLAPGERRTVTFELGPEQLSYHGPDMKRVVEPGRFQVMIGGSSDQVKPVEFEVVERTW